MPTRAKQEAQLLADIARAKRARLDAPSPSMVNSLPKAGTHLVMKVMESLPGILPVRLHLAAERAHLYPPRAGEPSILAGIVTPTAMSRTWVARTLARLPPGTWIKGHMPYSHAFSDLLSAAGVKMVLVLRDPRDVAVSSAAYLASQPRYPFWADFHPLSAEDRILASITGLPARNGRPALRNIRERLQSVLPWTREPFVRVSRFERLVGPSGGGSEKAQLQEIRDIAAHVGASLTEARARSIATGLFGGTETFRKGQIGGWREVFTERHVAAAKPLLDDLLVELGYERTTAWAGER